MYERKIFNDPLLLAVVFNQFDKVKEILDSGKYDNNLFSDIGESWCFGIPIPIHYISQCWDICFGQEFREPFNKRARVCHGNAGKILCLFQERKNIHIDEIPFSKIFYACWDDECESEETILEGKRSDYLSLGRREIDLDLFIAVNRMDFKKAKELLQKGANPNYKHYGENDEDLIDLCEGESSYQATCQAGTLLKSPGLFINSIDVDEIGSIFRWAANEAMWKLLYSYVSKKEL